MLNVFNSYNEDLDNLVKLILIAEITASRLALVKAILVVSSTVH